jgi:hypothetical protein
MKSKWDMNMRKSGAIQKHMIKVLIVALILGSWLGLARRIKHFTARYRMHYELLYSYKAKGQDQKFMYHWKMFDKYRDAAARPFFPVPDDPPEPQDLGKESDVGSSFSSNDVPDTAWHNALEGKASPIILNGAQRFWYGTLHWFKGTLPSGGARVFDEVISTGDY